MLMLLSSLNILLLSNAVSTRRDKSILFSRTTVIAFLYCFLLLTLNINLKFLENNISLFGGLISCKYYVQIFIGFLFLLVTIILILTSYYNRKILFEEKPIIFALEKETINLSKENTEEIPISHILGKEATNYWKGNLQKTRLGSNFLTNIFNRKGEQFKLTEYPLIILFVISGAIFLMSSNDLITIFLSIELQSYGLYIMCTLYRNSELSTNAGLTYFLLGGLSSCVILLGQGLLYLNTGNTNLDSIYLLEDIYENIYLNKLNILYFSILNYGILGFEDLLITNSHYSIQISLIIMSVGFLFKISAAPFHFWSPDVYDAIPTVVTTFVAIITKISILIILLELIYYSCNTLLTWKNSLILSSLLSLIIGSVLGLTQFRIKRLYAYSTISHLGFILLALSISKIESFQAFFFYLIQYSITNLNAFIILITIGYSFYNLIYKNDNMLNEEKSLKDTNYSPVQLIYQLKGYSKINPLLSISLSITLFSFIGVPPLVGFFGKQMILSIGLNEGYIFMTFIAILTSVISAVYYLVLMKNMFFEETNYIVNYNLDWNSNYTNNGIKVNTNTNIDQQIKLSSSLSNIISTITIIILIFILTPKEFYALTIILSLLYYI